MFGALRAQSIEEMPNIKRKRLTSYSATIINPQYKGRGTVITFLQPCLRGTYYSRETDYI